MEKAMLAYLIEKYKVNDFHTVIDIIDNECEAESAREDFAEFCKAKGKNVTEDDIEGIDKGNWWQMMYEAIKGYIDYCRLVPAAYAAIDCLKEEIEENDLEKAINGEQGLEAMKKEIESIHYDFYDSDKLTDDMLIRALKETYKGEYILC